MNDQIRGINLGGWLVLERWITPSLFRDSSAEDEFTFLGENQKNQKRLKKHYQKYIKESDFKWIKNHGFNAIRIPVGHWIFGDYPPFIGGIETLDRCFHLAKKYQLGVVISFHGAPGSQNGWDHSGKKGVVSWHTNPENIEKTLEVLYRLVKRYKKSKNFLGISLLNEPNENIPPVILEDFYRRSYQQIRDQSDVALMIHDQFFFFEHWQDFILKENLQNVILETHLYQCFGEYDNQLDLQGHLQKTLTEWKTLIEQAKVKVLVGEWSLDLGFRTLSELKEDEKDLAFGLYGRAQLLAFNNAWGNFFWTYKTENRPDWSIKNGIKRGWLTKI
jgi:glucan 1,3-beta-glucosidase